MRSAKRDLNLFLKKPYSRVVTPDEETGTFTGEILEFPGCITQGDTLEETCTRLEEAALSWIQAALSLGQSIPEPAILQGVGGKVVVRMPKGLHRQIVKISARESTSLNQFIVATLAEKVGASTMYEVIARKLDMHLMLAVATSAAQPLTTGRPIQRTALSISEAPAVYLPGARV